MRPRPRARGERDLGAGDLALARLAARRSTASTIFSVGAPHPMWLKDMTPPSVHVGSPPSRPMPTSAANAAPSPSRQNLSASYWRSTS